MVAWKIFCNFVANNGYKPLNSQMRQRILYLLLQLTFALSVNADNLGYSKDKPLLFGIDMDYAPMEYVDEKGIPHGFDVEFTQRLMARMNIPFTYAPNTWENIAGDVLHGKVDLGMMVYSPYRKDETNYSRAVFRLYYQIVYPKASKSRFGLRDVKGKKIALMKSRPIIDTLTKVGAEPIVIKDLKQSFYDLDKGKYDAVICFRYQARYLLEKYSLENLTAADLALMPREYCYVSHNKELIDAINDMLDKMEDEGVIDDVYGNIKTAFGKTEIPRWVWGLLTAVIIGGLIVVIVMQRRARKLIFREMKRAQQSEELKDVFLSNLSHALRTPLNAIIGFSDLLMNSPKDVMPEDEQNELLGLINNNGLQLLHLINELLSLSDIEGKTQLFEPTVTDVEQKMSEYASETRMQLNEGVELKVEESVGGMRALTDPKLLRVVTMHLLDNARQNTADGTITLSYYSKEDGLYVEVKDTGEGLPEKLKENIFTLLSDKNTYVQEETPGLGLSICKAIIDKAGGKIGARDNEEDGHGTIFWFWAPVKILT